MQEVLLTGVQSRIVLSILVSGTLGVSSLVKLARVSGSTWKKERSLLLRMGLVSFVERKEMHEDGIRRTKYYSLTEKGNQIADHVRTISNLLGHRELTIEKAPGFINK